MFYKDIMFNGQLVYKGDINVPILMLVSLLLLLCYNLQSESPGWLFKSPLAGGGAYCVSCTEGRRAYVMRQL